MIWTVGGVVSRAVFETVTVAVAEAPPRVSRTLPLAPSPTKLRRTLTIRHTSGHRIVALIEILSPGNKAAQGELRDFVRKANDAIRSRIHLAVIDLFLRSVWWHYRLRRYGDTLALETRPFARRGDEALNHTGRRIQQALGL